MGKPATGHAGNCPCLPAVTAQALGSLAGPVLALTLTDWPPFPHEFSGDSGAPTGLFWGLNGLVVVVMSLACVGNTIGAQ